MIATTSTPNPTCHVAEVFTYFTRRYYTSILVLHIGGACSALVSGTLALVSPPGTCLHRRCGQTYLGAWGVLAGAGLLLGRLHPDRVLLEVLTVAGASFAGLAYAAVCVRRRLGPAWFAYHYTGMLISLVFAWNATFVQFLLRVGIPVSSCYFWLALLLPPITAGRWWRRLRQRYGLR